MAEDEDPWRERGRAVLLGLILALGVVAMVLLSRRTGGREASPTEWPAVAGIYDVVAECEGCDCEPAETQGFAVVHPGLPVGRPVARPCDGPEGCAAVLQRPAPPSIRAPVVLDPGADPALVARELTRGPLMARSGEGFVGISSRERRGENECVVAQRTSELVPLRGGEWRWVERYDSGAGAECPARRALSCVAESRRRLRPRRR